MNPYTLFCDVCLKSSLITGNKVRYFIGKCAQIFCEACSGRVCSACKVVCNKKQISNNTEPDVKIYFLDSIPPLKRYLNGQEYQNNRIKKYLKFSIAHFGKKSKKLNELQAYVKKFQDEKNSVDLKIQQYNSKCEKMESRIKELELKKISDIQSQADQGANIMFNMFPNDTREIDNQALNDSFFVNNFSPDTSINMQHQGPTMSVFKSGFTSSRAPTNQASQDPFFQLTTPCNTKPERSHVPSSYGYRHMAPSTIFHQPPSRNPSKPFMRRKVNQY